jgi:hypothetical protein
MDLRRQSPTRTTGSRTRMARDGQKTREIPHPHGWGILAAWGGELCQAALMSVHDEESEIEDRCLTADRGHPHEREPFTVGEFGCSAT